MEIENYDSSINWLADAPLFIDENQIYRFYDAVVMPETEEQHTTLTISEANNREIAGKLHLGVEAKAPEIIGFLQTIFPSLSAKVDGGGEAKSVKTKNKGKTITLSRIKTPQRQLLQLSLHYLVNLEKKIHFPMDISEQEWREKNAIKASPRSLVFLDLPSEEEAVSKNLPTIKLIPTAAEFENGNIVLLYQNLFDRHYPEYPEKVRGESIEELIVRRKDYWQWYNDHFNATKAMIAIENAAKNNGKIVWIDYRMPINNEGETLHLHFCPEGKYSTGTFAYNLVKRGFKHGLRIVGTLKSEPDLNVLAVYEK